MPQHRDPTPPSGPNQHPVPKQQPIQGSIPKQSRAAAILTAFAILALPIGYLVQYYGHPQEASASSLPSAAPAQDIASLEETARTSPTVDNRINLSLAYIRANQPNRAIPILNGIVAENSKNAVAWNNLCVANTLQMAYQNAIDDCHNALRIAPDFQLAKNNLKWAEDEHQKAIVAITAQEKVAPAGRDAASYLNEGLDDLHLGNYDQAIKAWQRTLDLDPKSALAANNIGTAYMFKKEPAKAISWFEKALALDPTLQIAQNNLAWGRDVQAKSGK